MEKQEVKLGDIFYNSWGYDQTNIDFYKVVALTKKGVKIRQLKTKVTETGFMSGHCEPLSEFKNEETFFKKLNFSEGEAFLRLEFGWTSLWDGQPKSCSWYG